MKLLILSDVHGNLAALNSVLQAEADAGEILCLGDLVDYGPEPAACVAWAMQARGKSMFIQGNHDWGVALKKDPKSSPPFLHLTTCTQAFTLKAISQEMRHFLASLKPNNAFGRFDKRCVACHAAPSDPLFRHLRTTAKDLAQEIVVVGSPDFLFLGTRTGHC